MSRLDLSAVRAALGDMLGSFIVGEVDEGGGVEIIARASGGSEVAEAIGAAKERLEGAGLDAFATGGRLFVSVPRAEAPAGPWDPAWPVGAPWTSEEFDEDATLPEPADDEPDTEPEPPLFVRPFDPGRFRVVMQRAGADRGAIERCIAAARTANGGEIAGFRGERGAA